MKQLIKLAVGIVLVVCGTATKATAQKTLDDLNRYFYTLSRNQQFNGNVLIAEEGKILYERSFGYADLALNRTNSSRSAFPIASITKTFTSTAILQLQEKKKLQIRDAVVKYLPDFPYPAITIRHLLSHTSGLPDYDKLFLSLVTRYPDTALTNADIVPAFIAEKLPLSFTPGKSFEYNNVNFNVLALIVEKLSEIPFEQYLQENIFQPAGMTSTSSSLFFKRNDPRLSKLYRHRYMYSNVVEKPDTAADLHRGLYNYGSFKGHGDLISTASDLLKYDQALYEGSLLSDSSLQKAFTPVQLSDGQDNAQQYALGWMNPADTSLGRLVSHNGGMPGSTSILLRNITRHQTIILLDNGGNNVNPIAHDVLKIINGLPVATPRKSGARVYGTVLMNRGAGSANEMILILSKDTATYALVEDEFNTLGYELMNNEKEEAALETFKTNTLLFPDSWNVYDSYGEALLKAGKKSEAIEMYQKSLKLNPDNENGKKALEAIKKNTKSKSGNT